MPRMPKESYLGLKADVERILISSEEASALLGVGEAKIKKYCSDRKERGIDNGFPVAFGRHTKYLIHLELLREWVRDRVERGEEI